MKKLLTLILALSMIVSLCACGHEHTWKEATCTEPKTCSECGTTEGEPLGHTWKEATCTEPKTCTVCGAVEGEALGHDAGSWETVTEASLKEEGLEQAVCKRCGEIVETRSIEKKAIEYKNGKFNFTREEFMELVEDATEGQYSVIDGGKELDPKGGHAYGLYRYTSNKGFISFIENKAGEVTSIVVWGNDYETAKIAILTLELLCGYEPGAKSDFINSALEKNNSCKLDGLTMTFKFEGSSGGKDFVSFTITG